MAWHPNPRPILNAKGVAMFADGVTKKLVGDMDCKAWTLGQSVAYEELKRAAQQQLWNIDMREYMQYKSKTREGRVPPTWNPNTEASLGEGLKPASSKGNTISYSQEEPQDFRGTSRAFPIVIQDSPVSQDQVRQVTGASLHQIPKIIEIKEDEQQTMDKIQARNATRRRMDRLDIMHMADLYVEFLGFGYPLGKRSHDFSYPAFRDSFRSNKSSDSRYITLANSWYQTYNEFLFPGGPRDSGGDHDFIEGGYYIAAAMAYTKVPQGEWDWRISRLIEVVNEKVEALKVSIQSITEVEDKRKNLAKAMGKTDGDFSTQSLDEIMMQIRAERDNTRQSLLLGPPDSITTIPSVYKDIADEEAWGWLERPNSSWSPKQ